MGELLHFLNSLNTENTLNTYHFTKNNNITHATSPLTYEYLMKCQCRISQERLHEIVIIIYMGRNLPQGCHFFSTELTTVLYRFSLCCFYNHVCIFGKCFEHLHVTFHYLFLILFLDKILIS